MASSTPLVGGRRSSTPPRTRGPQGRTGRVSSREVGAGRRGRATAEPPAPPQSGAPAQAKGRPSRYVPSLDGLRALALIAVVTYHFRSEWAPAGLLGVTMFFVLSGYLITGLLITEWNRTRAIDLKTFWIKRIRRLVPAIIFVLLVMTTATALFNAALLTKMRDDILSSLFFFNNWWQIAKGTSYFDQIGQPSPLTHFWSLAIEEQFYILWPVLLLIAFRAKTPKKLLIGLIALLAAASAIEMAVLYVPGGDPTRVYYGTDTRAFSLLLGALLAFRCPVSRLSRTHQLWNLRGWQVDALGAGCLAVIVIMVLTVDPQSPFLYRGGFLLVSLITCVLMATLVNPHGVMHRIFAWKPLVWLGKRSYGIYLWHYPLLLLTTPINVASELPLWLGPVQVALILGASELSYRLVEDPCRHGAIGKLYHNLKDGRTTPGGVFHAHPVKVVGTGVLVAASVILCLVTPRTEALGNMDALYQDSDDPTALAQKQEEQTDKKADGATDGTTDATATDDGEKSDDGATSGEDVTTKDYLLIGDSVSLGAKDKFKETFPNSFIDSKISRRIDQGAEIYKSWKAQGWDGDAVIFALGTNVKAPKAWMDSLLDSVGDDKPIYLITVRTPAGTQDSNNALIRQAAEERDNVKIIDWYAASEGHGEYFDGDGTHLNQAGRDAYVAMIQQALQADADSAENRGETQVMELIHDLGDFNPLAVGA